MNALSLRPDEDSSPTLVTRTRVMDRRPLPPMSGVVPIARSTERMLPPESAPAAPRVSSIPPPPPSADMSPEMTQPAYRLKRENKVYRRIAIGLVIALAFVSGTAAAFAVQLASMPPTFVDRQPRVASIRGASLRLVDGAPSKVESHDAPAAPRHAGSARGGRVARSAAATAQSVQATQATQVPQAASPPEEPTPAPEVSARDLLDKGITAD